MADPAGARAEYAGARAEYRKTVALPPPAPQPYSCGAPSRGSTLAEAVQGRLGSQQLGPERVEDGLGPDV